LVAGALVAGGVAFCSPYPLVVGPGWAGLVGDPPLSGRGG